MGIKTFNFFGDITVNGGGGGGGGSSNLFSVHLDGSSAIDFGSDSSLHPERTTPWSMVMWLKNSSDGVLQTLWGNTSGMIPDQGIWCLVNTGTLDVYLINTYPSNYIRVTVPYGGMNTWFNITVTYDGSSTAAGVKIYLDGVLQTNTVDSDALSASIVSSNTFQIGSAQTDLPFTGNINQSAWFLNKVLNGTQVAAIWNLGVPADLSSYAPTSWWQFQNDFTDTQGLNNGSAVGSPTFVMDVPP